MSIDEIIGRSLLENRFIYCVFTTPRKKNENGYKKIVARPVAIKGENIIQFEKFTELKAFHINLNYEDAVDEILNLIKNEYKNVNIFTENLDYQLLISKRGSIKIIEKEPTKKLTVTEHNKTKQYIINENEPCEFLYSLGVMNENGQVYKKKYDKFKQINKFLEIVEDSLKDVEVNDDFMIIDFGCGKAYLTFALYHYFYEIKKINVKIIGLDLKDDVIKFCNEVAGRLNYNNLKFQHGDIKDYEYQSKVNMIVTLHACDNATDSALVKSIKWNADVILSVPCCQHEFYDKINNEFLEPMLKHGLVRERISSLVTDSLRSLFLETKGYKVQLLEFISMEHTPKNILIRAIRAKKTREKSIEEYDEFKKFWNLKDIFIEEYFNSR